MIAPIKQLVRCLISTIINVLTNNNNIHNVFLQVRYEKGRVYATLFLSEAGKEIIFGKPSVHGTHNQRSKKIIQCTSYYLFFA